MNVLKPNKQVTLEVLFARGTPLREIARITGIDRKTVRSYHQRWLLATSNSPTPASGSEVSLTSPCEIPPSWPPAFRPKPSLCEPYREFIEAQRRLKRNATAIYQDLVDLHGFGGAYNSVKRFVAKLDDAPAAQPFDRLAFMLGSVQPA